jgi:hypothetical protein
MGRSVSDAGTGEPRAAFGHGEAVDGYGDRFREGVAGRVRRRLARQFGKGQKGSLDRVP